MIVFLLILKPVPASPGQMSQVFPLEKGKHVGEYCMFIHPHNLSGDE